MNLHKKKNTTDWTAASSRYSFAELNSKWRALCVPIDIFKYMSKIQINFGVCVCDYAVHANRERIQICKVYLYMANSYLCIFIPVFPIWLCFVTRFIRFVRSARSSANSVLFYFLLVYFRGWVGAAKTNLWDSISGW